MNDKPHKVLIVDDVMQSLVILNEILKNEFSVQMATSGAEALQIAGSAEPPELILLDIMMPEMDGFEVLQKLKSDEKTRDIPVSFVTAKNEMDDRMRGFDLGVAFYITKPIDPTYVLDVVRKHFIP